MSTSDSDSDHFYFEPEWDALDDMRLRLFISRQVILRGCRWIIDDGTKVQSLQTILQTCNDLIGHLSSFMLLHSQITATSSPHHLSAYLFLWRVETGEIKLTHV
ncbi:hypothetical protein QL285_029840 [Trifolium repens]|nr:hypothetical protein QL285_029840 [Trifolium repens]